MPAYVTVAGNPAAAVGMNVEGMRRRGYGPELIAILRGAFKILYRCGLTAEEACKRLRTEHADCPEVECFVASVEASEVGVIRPRRNSG